MGVLRAAFAGSISVFFLAVSSQLSALSVAARLVAEVPEQAAAPTRASRDTAPLALVGGKLHVAPDLPVINDGVVVITDGRITRAGPRATTPVPDGAATIDCRGLFITAGFQNSHAHFTEEKWAEAATQPEPKLAAQLQAMLTRFGVTTVVDTASLLSNTVALRQRIEAGEIAGPRILTAGLALYPPGGVPYYVRDTVSPDLLKRCTEIQSNGQNLVLNLSEVTFMGSSGVGALLVLVEQFQEQAGAVHFAALSHNAQDVIDLLDLGQYLPIHATEAEAFAALEA
jgi:anti-anti-sigma factor